MCSVCGVVQCVGCGVWVCWYGCVDVGAGVGGGVGMGVDVFCVFF